MTTRTNFSTSNQSFSDSAHDAAVRLVYPHLFGVDPQHIEVTDTTLTGATTQERRQRAQFLDGEMGIDKVLFVNYGTFSAPLPHTVQERFRRPDFAKFRDITFTEWNEDTDKPSEMQKNCSQWFVYGYYDQERDNFLEVVACPTPTLVHALGSNQLRFTRQRNPRSNQPFVCILIDDILRQSLHHLHMVNNKVMSKRFTK